MAELDRDSGDLVVKLSTVEKAEAVHGDIRVPIAAVRSVEVVEDALHAVSAFTKSIGASFPGRFVIGTFHTDGTTFAVVHHGTPRGIRVRLEGANFDQLLVGCDDPEGTVQRLDIVASAGS
ncbi:MAG: hypothetical protein ACRDXC_05980 [Acidimicrobiales bacterium]